MLSFCFLLPPSKRTFPGICLLSAAMLVAPALWADHAPPTDRGAEIMARMEAAYARVEGYRTETEVNDYREGEAVGMKRFLYTFRKPNHVRIDMKSPNPGMVLVYPDENGKVAVKPGGWAGFLKLHLSPDNALLRTSAGQRIDQTDLGLLIRNIGHSLTDRRRGESKVIEEEGRVRIEVPAEDHFMAGVVTLYHFTIDTARWLPVEIKEFTPDGVLKRTVIFRNMQTASAIPDSLFRIEGGNPGDGQLDR